jgi:hypothetical protein
MSLFDKFPRYATHADARCFKCDAPMATSPHGVIDSGCADGRGRYAMHCDACRLRTWYDVGPAPATRRPATMAQSSCGAAVFIDAAGKHVPLMGAPRVAALRAAYRREALPDGLRLAIEAAAQWSRLRGTTYGGTRAATL